ncbi:MAG: sugar phosphate nucleotidyltransferase, partial [Tepidisphaeraceae bacterium]
MSSSTTLSAPLRKAVIPAAGIGTRMFPAAKAIPKELLPVIDRPTIQYVVQEAGDAGLRDVLLIISPDKQAIEQHFQRDVALEDRLKASGREKLLQSVNDLIARVKIYSVHQAQQRGLGDAVLQARRH